MNSRHFPKATKASKKKMWYFAGVPGGGHREFDMSEIRDRYGCQRVTITGHGFRDAIRHPAGQWAIRTADGYRGVADARDLEPVT